MSIHSFPIVFAYPEFGFFGGPPELQTTGGTSASAPIVASFIAAINDARIAAGKGPVGWINPAVSPFVQYAASE